MALKTKLHKTKSCKNGNVWQKLKTPANNCLAQSNNSVPLRMYRIKMKV